MATSEELIVPGLERLTRLATVNLHQKDSFCEGNMYAVLAEDELLFDMKEDCRASTFIFSARIRGFRINSVDNTGRHVFSIRRPSVFVSDKVELYMNDTLVSIVRSKVTCITPVFNINDADDATVLRVKGGHAEINKFKLQTTDKAIIGSLTKQNRDLLSRIFSDNHYIITFPADLDVHFKLAVICTCVLIDYRYHGN